MARARLLKPGFFTNPKLASLPPHARLLFAGLWTLADREGRLKDEPATIKGALFPYEDVPVADLLTMLARGAFIKRYSADAQKYIAVVAFLKHQTPHIREGASQIPEPPQKHEASTVLAPDKHRARTALGKASPAVTGNGNRYTETVAVTQTREPLDALVADFSAFGSTNGGTVKAIEYAVDDYGLETVQRAVREAAGSGFEETPPWSYVEKILKRWKAQGGQEHDQPSRNGTSTPRRADATTGHNAADAERELYAKLTREPPISLD